MEWLRCFVLLVAAGCALSVPCWAQASAPGLAAAETRTLTSKDGRSIEVEILSHKEEMLRVRRADTKREFQIPLSSLAEVDQEAMKRFTRERPDLRETVRPGDIRVEYSRAKFERETTAEVYWREEDEEGWGFSIAVLNQTSQPLEGLRVEYVVYALNDPDKVYAAYRNKTDAEKILRIPGSEKFESIAPLQRVAFRTQPVVVRRVKYTGGVRMMTADGKLVRNWRDKELHGLWLRVYDGDKVIFEASSPESLRTSEQWGASN